MSSSPPTSSPGAAITSTADVVVVGAGASGLAAAAALKRRGREPVLLDRDEQGRRHLGAPLRPAPPAHGAPLLGPSLPPAATLAPALRRPRTTTPGTWRTMRSASSSTCAADSGSSASAARPRRGSSRRETCSCGRAPSSSPPAVTTCKRFRTGREPATSRAGCCTRRTTAPDASSGTCACSLSDSATVAPRSRPTSSSRERARSRSPSGRGRRSRRGRSRGFRRRSSGWCCIRSRTGWSTASARCCAGSAPAT